MKLKLSPLLLCVVLLSLFSGCGNRGAKYLSKPESDFTFSARTEPCFGTCPVYDLNIHSSGKAIYNGLNFTKLEGKHEKQLPSTVVDSLRTLLIEMQYLQLDSVYNDPYIADIPSTHFRLVSEQGKIDKKVWARYEEPKSVLELEAFIDGIRVQYFTSEQ